METSETKHQKPLNIFIVGYYGFKNAGDELLLKKTICLLKDQYLTPKICAIYKAPHEINKETAHFSFNTKNPPYKNSDLFGEITLCPRNSYITVIKSLFLADILIFGGGGLLQDKTSKRSLIYYLKFLLFALIFRKKIYLIAQGLGPFKSRISKWLIANLLKRTTGISVRDKTSYKISKIFAPNANIILTSDLAYYKAVTSEEESLNQPSIGLSLRGSGLNQSIIDALTTFAATSNETLVFLDFQQVFDSKKIHTIEPLSKYIKNTISMNDYFINQQDSQISFNIVIGMRYHACVWASLHFIPFLALAYDPKVKSLAKELGQEYIDLTNSEIAIPKNLILKKFNTIKKNHSHYKTKLKDITPTIIERANSNSKIFS
jgi:polysaccharide pyruvyl transferase CsaB